VADQALGSVWQSFDWNAFFPNTTRTAAERVPNLSQVCPEHVYNATRKFVRGLPDKGFSGLKGEQVTGVM
jgi:hypothetical protein